jgi:hypothetical protein
MPRLSPGAACAAEDARSRLSRPVALDGRRMLAEPPTDQDNPAVCTAGCLATPAPEDATRPASAPSHLHCDGARGVEQAQLHKLRDAAEAQLVVQQLVPAPKRKSATAPSAKLHPTAIAVPPQWKERRHSGTGREEQHADSSTAHRMHAGAYMVLLHSMGPQHRLLGPHRRRRHGGAALTGASVG